MLKTMTRVGTAAMLMLIGACGGGDGDGDVESATEQLRPAANRCVTSEDCLYGYCSTEDGECYGAPACLPGTGTCELCYGTCIAAAPPS